MDHRAVMNPLDSTSSVSVLAASTATLFCGLFLLAACDSLSNAQKRPSFRVTSQSASAAVGDSLTVEGDTIVFRRVKPGDAPQDPPPVAVNVTDEGLSISGYFLAFTKDVDLEGEIDRSSGEVEIRVKAVARGDSYPRMPGPFFYEAQLTELSAGTYKVRVLHEGDVLQDPEKGPVTVLEKTLTVQ